MFFILGLINRSPKQCLNVQVMKSADFDRLDHASLLLFLLSTSWMGVSLTLGSHWSKNEGVLLLIIDLYPAEAASEYCRVRVDVMHVDDMHVRLHVYDSPVCCCLN